MATPQSRSKLYSIGAISLAVGLALFLVLSPAVEREAYLAQIRDPQARWDSAMLHLCWIEPGRAGLNASLPDLDHGHRIGVLEEARKVGCLNLLAPALQAQYWIWNPDVEGAKGEAIALGRESVEPALGAVESSAASGAGPVRRHAVDVLVALQAELEDAEVARMTAAGVDEELAGLTARFGGPDAGDGGESFDAGGADLATDSSDAGTDESDVGADDGGADGDDAAAIETAAPSGPGEIPRLRLREPRLEVKSPGVLFAADSDGDDGSDAANAPPSGVELAPPPQMPSDKGDEDVEQ